MMTANYAIAFNFQLENSGRVVTLTAQVEKHQSATYFIVKNFRRNEQANISALPDLKIKKLKGKWVHFDSEQESNLSVEVGKAIDAYEGVHSGKKRHRKAS
jgi:hypothetical protein